MVRHGAPHAAVHCLVNLTHWSHIALMATSSQKNPMIRVALLVLGVLVILISPIVGAIPGPGGIFVFAAGLVLVLQNSLWARRNFARWKRRWPRFGHYADMALRRRSFRRRQRKQQEAEMARAEIVAAGLNDPETRS